MTTLFRYHAFGLDFQSEIQIPEMREGHAGCGEPVFIRNAPAPCPDGLKLVVADVAAGPQDFWMEVPGVVRLHVSDGSLITIEPAAGAATDDIRAYLLGSAMGALLYQRDYLPLHASAVAIDGVAVAFCGGSGDGKSSIAHALVGRGHQLICDDIAAVSTSDGVNVLWPGLVTLKLWGDRITAAGERSAGLRPVLAGMDKYLRPVEGLAPFSSYRLGHVIKLTTVYESQVTMTPLTGSSGAAMLVANSFRGQLMRPMQRERPHFAQCTALANAAQIWTLARCWSHQEMTATCAAVEEAVRTS
jgi:HPr Serine kinase C-terminal domain